MSKKPPEVLVQFPPKMHPPDGLSTLFTPARYKVWYGGRGAGKSWSIAQALLIMGSQKPLRILCAREYQSSINQSVWQLLCDSIDRLQLHAFYDIEKTMIRGKNGTQFTFQGIKQHISSIKSFEGTDICWCEEAADISENSWSVLIPTIRRKANSEIWVSFNPTWEDSPTYQRFVVNPPPGAIVTKINWYDNPFLGPDLKMEIEELRFGSPEQYRVTYEGECQKYLDGAVYSNELRDAEEQERITEVRYQPQCGVETFWDIGIGDATAIWIAQRVGHEYHLIDYIEDTGKPVSYFLTLLNGDKRRFPFPIDRYWLPHDATAREKGTGLSVEEMIRNKGYRVSVVPKLRVSDGINAVRTMFPLMYFDRLKCAHGLIALRSYTYETKGDRYSEHSYFKNEPRHDKYSHSADALRYMALALRPPKAKKPMVHNEYWAKFNQSNTSWMNV